MKLKILCVILISFFSTQVLADDLWSEFNVKRAKREIDFAHHQIRELKGLSNFVDKEQYRSKLKNYNDSLKETLASLDKQERATLIKSYESHDPELAATLRKLK